MLSLASKSGGDSPNPRRGTRITPRTCLWPLAGSLVVTFALSIGLTFRSDHYCYAGTCGEWLFPLQARLHVVIWYAWISASVTFLAVRSFHPQMQKFLGRAVIKRDLILVHKHLTIGGVILLVWVIALYGAVVALWWIRLRDYFVGRGEANGIFHGGYKLAAIALTGHFCDITMGMVLIPISRHSALASFFKLSPSTTLTNHMLTAYTLFSLALIHGFLYLSWVPDFNSLSEGLRRVIPVLNPTYQYHEIWPGSTSTLGVWRASLIFTGCVSATIMSVIFITTLPRIRSNYFNLFYFTHFLTIIMVIIICLHASTMFYCTAPGLVMWFLDWGMRFYELRRVLPSEITNIGNEWYCITVPLPRSRLTGCSCRSPLAHFYIHHAGSSIRELHPFTTITPLAAQSFSTPETDDFPIQFLFRKRGLSAVPASSPKHSHFRWLTRLFLSKKKRIQSTQWTDRLAGLVDQRQVSMEDLKIDPSVKTVTTTSKTTKSKPFPIIDISLRLEGPYFSPADPSHHQNIICLVAGTGISGAIAIASAFAFSQEQRRSKSLELATPKITAQRCVVIWSVRADKHVEMPFLSGLEVETHLTGSGRPRLDMQEAIRRATRADAGVSETSTTPADGKKTWVYISGPKPFMDAGKTACEGVGGVDVYAPSWDV